MAEPDARVKVGLAWSEAASELPEHAEAPTTASPARAASARRALMARRRASRALLRDWPGLAYTEILRSVSDPPSMSQSAMDSRVRGPARTIGAVMCSAARPPGEGRRARPPRGVGA